MTEQFEQLKALRLDDLPEAHRKLAEVIGVEATIKLCADCGGLSLYIPMLDTLQEAARRAAIRAEYNGSNTAQLARKHGITQRTVQYIVQDLQPKIDGQIDMFEAL